MNKIKLIKLVLQLGVQQFSSDFCVYLKFLIIFKAGQLKEKKET